MNHAVYTRTVGNNCNNSTRLNNCYGECMVDYLVLGSINELPTDVQDNITIVSITSNVN